MDQFQTSQDSANENNKVDKKKPWYKNITEAYALLFIIVLSFSFGLITSIYYQESPQTSEEVISKTTDQLWDIFRNNEDVDVGIFKEAWDVIHSDYLDKGKISDKDLFYGAIAGMIDALDDPHSFFLDPEITDDFTQELDGSFYGIGAEIGRKNGSLVVIAPLSNTPADKAGLKPGDKIFAIDGLDTSSMSVNQAVYHIRGDKGEAVVLTVLSKEANATRDVSIVRAKIDIPSVIYRTEDNIAIIAISHFNSDTGDKFSSVVQKVLNNNPRGIILDLRNNPGGFLNTAVEITSAWLEPEQVVVRETYSDKRLDTNHKAMKRLSLADFTTVVLVNEGSASASEIVAGALQDYEKAQVVGMTTFGKGSVQQLIPLKDDSSIKLTVARWLTPKGRTIDEEGIVPDIEIDLTEDDYNNNLDPQLDKAKELILQ